MEPIRLRDLAVFAGASEEKWVDGPRSSNAFFRPSSVCPSSQGELYVADSGNHRIRFINKYGSVTTHAGDGRKALRNGRLEAASFNHPTGICRTSQGHLLISDSGNHVIRIITTQGAVKTYAGTGEIGCKDGQANDATFNSPLDLCVDFQGQLYIADTGNHRIRLITASRVVQTTCGSSKGYRDGARDEALFDTPNCVRLTPTRLGTLLIADTGNHCIRLLNNGYITTFAGRADQPGFLADTRRLDTLFQQPVSLAVGPDEAVYVSDAGNHCIYLISPNDTTSILTGGTQGCQDGSREQAAFKRPGGICLVAQRQLILAEIGHGRILIVKHDGSIANFAGRSRAGTIDGPVAKSTFFKPQALFSASSNDLLVADSMSNKIRRIRNGVVTTYAGAPERGLGNGRKDLANFDRPTGICISSSNVVYIADTNNHVIRHITDGTVHTFAGTGEAGFADGAGNTAKFDEPIGIILVGSSMLLVSDMNNHRLRSITKDGVVSTFAGSEVGFQDGPALQARFRSPAELVSTPAAADGSYTIFISDHLNHAIRVLRSDSMTHSIWSIATLAGNGEPGNIDGLRPSVRFNQPRGLALTPDNHLLVADSGNRSIRILSLNGNTSTFIVPGDLDPEDRERLNVDPDQVPTALSLTSSGVLFVADMLRNQILYLPCPQWDLTRQVPKSKEYAGFFSFADLQNAPPETFDFSFTHQSSEQEFKLHKFFVNARCPMLCQPEILAKVAQTPSVEAVNNLVRLILTDNLTPLTATSHLNAAFELAYLSSLLNKPQWVSMVHYHIEDFLKEKSPIRTKRRASDAGLTHPVPVLPTPGSTSTSPSSGTTIPSPQTEHDLAERTNDCLNLLAHIYTYCASDESLIDIIVNYLKALIKPAPMPAPRSRTPSISGPSGIVGGVELSSSPNPSSSSLDPNMISFKFAKPTSTARYTPPPPGSELAGSPNRSNPIAMAVSSQAPHPLTSSQPPYPLSSSPRPVSPRIASESPAPSSSPPSRASTTVQSSPATSRPSSPRHSLQMADSSSASAVGSFEPDFSRLALVSVVLQQKVLAKFATPLDASGGAHLSPSFEHSLSVDMTSLYERCVARRTLHSSQSSGDDSSSTTTLPGHQSNDGSSDSDASSPGKSDLMDVDNVLQPVSSIALAAMPQNSVLDPDFEIIVASQRFPCHKYILFARWPHFADLVKNGHDKVNHGQLVITSESPMTAEVVQGLLRYWYTNEVEQLPHTDSFCLGVLKSALLYEFVMPGDLSNQPVRGFELLMLFCRNALIKPLTIENCAPLLNTLFEYGSSTQQNRVISYISRNLKQVMESQNAAKALASVPPVLHSKILFSHFSMLQVLEEQ